MLQDEIAAPKTLLIACAALARELKAIIALNGWKHIRLTCLPAELHNQPKKITAAVQAQINAARPDFSTILCLYGDCGTGGALDGMLAGEGVERIEGAHCYAFYTGVSAFDSMAESEPGTFYLTDYLVRHFDRLVIKGLGLDRHPELLSDYFGHYTRVLYLSQMQDPDLELKAKIAAERLALPLEIYVTGLSGIAGFLSARLPGEVPFNG